MSSYTTYLEYAIMFFWAVFTVIQPSMSFVSGAIIFYMIQLEKGVLKFNFKYMILLLCGSAIMGHYTNLMLPLVAKGILIGYVEPLGFILGLFAKLILDIILTKKWVARHIKGDK